MKEKPETRVIKLFAQSPTVAMGQSSDSGLGGSGSSSTLLTPGPLLGGGQAW